MEIKPMTDEITIYVDLGNNSEGFVVINSTYANCSVGGLRIADDINLEEIQALAREMTLKYSLFGILRGGAKAGIRVPSGAPDQKADLLLKFGQAIRPIIRRGLYFPWMDINCSREDIQTVYKGAGYQIGPSTDTALFTAISTRETLIGCREYLGNPSKPLRLAIEGFGNVATHLAKMLPPDQFLITAVSTVKGAIIDEDGFDSQELAAKKGLFGDDLVNHLERTSLERDSLFGSDVDIFLPSARTWSISEKTAPKIRARYIVPIANAPYGGTGLNYLEANGVVCFPGFVVNAGGVFGSTLFDSGVSLKEVERLSASYFRPLIQTLLDIQHQNHSSIVSLTGSVARERLLHRPDPYKYKLPFAYDALNAARNILVPKLIFGKIRAREFINTLIEVNQQVKETGS
jgi:glutamate dehydrogenase (NAD(P)+)